LSLVAETNSTLGGDAGVNGATTITSGAVTASTVTLNDYSTVSDGDANANEALTITGNQTALTMTIGRNVTFTDDISFTGNVTRLNLTTNTAAETVTWDNANDLNIAGGTVDVLFGAAAGSVVETRITHSGTGVISYDGTNVGTSSVTGNIGNDVLTGGAGNDTFSGGLGTDSLTGAAGNDNLTAGEGADTVNGGAGNDAISLTETTSAADLVRLSAVVGTSTDSANVNVADALDTGGDTITGYNLAVDTTTITATNVVAFVHGTHTTVGTGTTTTSATGAAGEFTKLTGLIQLDSAAAGDAIAIGAAATGDIAVTYASLANGANAVSDMTATGVEAAWEATLRYNITGTAAANTITTGALADTITGGAGGDILTGGAGADTFVATTRAESLIVGNNANFGTDFDQIQDFVSGTDKLDLAGDLVATPLTAAVDGNANLNARTQAFDTDFATTVANAITALGANSFANVGDVIVLTITGGTAAQNGVYVIQNSANAAFAAADDLVLKLVGTSSATLVVGDFI
jgi:Ca2+-binding RTX toxin-like protein